MRKRWTLRIVHFMIFLSAILLNLSISPHAKEDTSKAKMIHVVYDDSRSMYLDNETRWCQAKYALEVFSAMLDKNDVMNVYSMNREDILNIKGSDESRVKKVHQMTSTYAGTPFSVVMKAGDALKKVDTSYERWLIILTDGSFDNTSQAKVQSTLKKYNAAGIKTVYLAIGNDAVELKGDVNKGLYAEKAVNTKDILKKVTNIANQIFEHQVLDEGFIKTSKQSTQLDIDIPTDQIVVFAQGENVSLGDMTLNGTKITRTSSQSVRHSGDVLPLNKEKIKTDTSLHGIVATYDAGNKPFESGQFAITVSNAKTIEYYYKPGVTVNCELFYEGKVVNKDDKLKAGKYDIKLSFINPLTDKQLDSKLLSSAKLQLNVLNNGIEQVVKDNAGTINLTEGNVEIKAVAELPGNVFLSSTKNYSVMPEPKKLIVDLSKPLNDYDLNNLDKAENILIHVRYKDTKTNTIQSLTKEMWEVFELDATSENRISWNVEKGNDVGTWLLKPAYYHGDPLLSESGETAVTVKVEGTINDYTYTGSGTQQAYFSKLSVLNIIKILAPRVLLLLFIIWLLIGYIKKKRLHTRGLDPRCRFKNTTSPKRKIRKEFLSVVLPYVPEKAVVECNKSAFQCNCPNLRIQAAGKRSFKIMNPQLPLKKIRICGEFYSDMETLKKRIFHMGSFDVTSVDIKTGNKKLGTFTFK